MAPSESDNTRSLGSRVTKAFLSAFWTPSLLAVTVCLATTTTLFLAAIILLEPQRFATSTHRYFMREDADSQVLTTARSLELSERSSPLPSVVIIGASATRAGQVSESELTELLRAEGADLQTQNLTLGAQNIWEMSAILDKVESGVSGVAVIGVGMALFCRDMDHYRQSIEQPRLGFVSEVFDHEAELAGIEMPRRTGIYVVDNYRFLIPRQLFFYRNLFLGPPDTDYLRYDQRPAVSPFEWKSRANELRSTFADFERESPRNFATLQRLVDRLQSDRLRIALVEQPLNPRTIREVIGPEAYRDYQRRVSDFAASAGTTYWDLSAEAAFRDEDFYDWCHINSPSARERWSKRLAVKAAQLYKTMTP